MFEKIASEVVDFMLGWGLFFINLFFMIFFFNCLFLSFRREVASSRFAWQRENVKEDVLKNCKLREGENFE